MIRFDKVMNAVDGAKSPWSYQDERIVPPPVQSLLKEVQHHHYWKKQFQLNPFHLDIAITKLRLLYYLQFDTECDIRYRVNDINTWNIGYQVPTKKLQKQQYISILHIQLPHFQCLYTWELLNLTLGSQLQHGIPLFLLWHLIGRRGPICYLPSTIFTPEVWSQQVYKRMEIICVKIDDNWNTYTPCIVQHAYHLEVCKTIVKNCTPEWHIKRHKMKCL